jgi:hypothetical protein
MGLGVVAHVGTLHLLVHAQEGRVSPEKERGVELKMQAKTSDVNSVPLRRGWRDGWKQEDHTNLEDEVDSQTDEHGSLEGTDAGRAES